MTPLFYDGNRCVGNHEQSQKIGFVVLWIFMEVGRKGENFDLNNLGCLGICL